MTWLAYVYLVASLHLPPSLAELAAEHPPAMYSVSAYCEVGLTASGVMAGPGLAACGPGYAFGTLFVLSDGRVMRCMDRGGLVSDGHLDLWLPSYADAVKWGRQNMAAWRIGE